MPQGLRPGTSSFKLEHPLEKRQAEAQRIREKYPDRIPVSTAEYVVLLALNLRHGT